MPTPVHFLCRSGIGQLVVVQHRVDVGQHLLHELPGHVARRFDGRVEAALVGPFQQGRAEVRLQQALAAAQRDAAPGVAVEGAVLLHLVQHLVDGHPLAEHLERACRAERRHVLVAVAGQVPVDMDLVIGALDHIERAFGEGRLQTHAARRLAGALPGVVGKLGLEGDALGVAAPLAAQRAALEEHVRADARAVVAAVALDVQHDPGGSGWGHSDRSQLPPQEDAERSGDLHELAVRRHRPDLVDGVRQGHERQVRWNKGHHRPIVAGLDGPHRAGPVRQPS